MTLPAAPRGGTLDACHSEAFAMKILPPLLCLFALAACSGKPPEPTAQPAAAASSRVATPWDAMKADEQRAKDVQKIVDKQAADQNKQIEAQTQ
jgi:uncharacterized lipoprotein YajG